MPDTQEARTQMTAAPILLTTEAAAAVLGLPKSIFHALRGEPWMPKPVVLSAKLVRWPYHELLAATARMPRGSAGGEPPQLARGKAARAGRPAPFNGALA